jgi:thiamine kinase-like enzyme
LDETKALVIKLYHKEVPVYHIKKERVIHAYVTKQEEIPAPKLLGEFDYNGRKGLVMEYIEGDTLSEFTRRKPWKIGYAVKKMVELHSLIHTIEADNLKEPILGYVGTESLLCHGDFHFNNIIITKNNDLKIIDWMNAGKGDPLFDVCRSYLMLKAPSTSRGVLYRFFANFIKSHIAEMYLNSYCKFNKIEQDAILSWKKLVAQVRIAEGVLKFEAAWWERIVKQA